MKIKLSFHCLSSFNWKYKTPIPCFLKILIPYYQISISCYWIHIDPIFTISKNPLHVFDRYWSNIQSFRKFIRRMFGIVLRPPFPKYMAKYNVFVKTGLGISWIRYSILVSPKIDNIVLGVTGTSKNPKFKKMMGFVFFKNES